MDNPDNFAMVDSIATNPASLLPKPLSTGNGRRGEGLALERQLANDRIRALAGGSLRRSDSPVT